MFGKKSHQSANERFVTDMGRKAGNLKGRGTAPKTAPMQKVASKQSALPSPDAMKRGVAVNQNKPQSLGKVNTFNTTRRVPR